MTLLSIGPGLSRLAKDYRCESDNYGVMSSLAGICAYCGKKWTMAGLITLLYKGSCLVKLSSRRLVYGAHQHSYTVTKTDSDG
jgi:hypothetical protein